MVTKAACLSYALALNLKWCCVLYEHITSDLMWCHWTFKPFDLLFFSCCCWYSLSFSLMTADPLCSCCHSSPVVRRFVLLSKALDRWAGVHNSRWVFCGYSIGRCSSIFLFSRFFFFSSSILGVRLTNTSTWMLKVWFVENLSAK